MGRMPRRRLLQIPLDLCFIHIPFTIIWLPLSMPITLLSTTTPLFTPTMLPLLSMLPLMSARTKVELVPCAHGVAPGSAIYAMADAPTVAAAPAAAPQEEAVVSVEKRDAEADAEADPAAWYYGYYGHPYRHHYGYAGYYGYYGHPYYGYGGVGCRNNLGALVPCAGK